MKKILAKFGLKGNWSFSENGVEVVNSSEQKCVVAWSKINKIVFVDYFEEYSGYFLTDDFLSKKLYTDIKIDCSKNEVRIRTGSSPVLKKNMTNAFTTKHGTTCVKQAVFVEYVSDKGEKLLYANHFNSSKKTKEIQEIEKFIDISKITKKTRVDGFNHLASL